MDTVGFEKNTGAGNFPWLLLLCIISWYILYGFGLWATNQPTLYWIVAVTVATFLAGAIATSQLLAVPLFLLATWLFPLRLLIDSLIVRGSDELGRSVNLFLKGGWLNMAVTGAIAFLLALFWFSPLFLAQRRMKRNGFSRRIIFFGLAIASWIGLGLGRLITLAIGN
jgi:hypothetical protein